MTSMPVPEATSAPSGQRAWTVLSAGRRSPVDNVPSGRRLLTTLVVAACVVVAVLALAASYLSRQLATTEAIDDGVRTCDLLADAIVAPLATPALIAGDAQARARLDGEVRRGVTPHGVVRVKLFTPEGVVVYSDEPRLIGQRFALGPEELDALTSSRTNAAVSTMEGHENEFERPEGTLLEVRRPLVLADGSRLLFEVYVDYEQVWPKADSLRRAIMALLAVSTFLFFALLGPVAWGLLRRLRAAQAHQEDLLKHAVDASDEERRRLASDLHDGPVQDLVASSLALEGTAHRLAGESSTAATAVTDSARTVRAAVAGLRSLLVDLYPPHVARAGLPSALDDLVTPLRASGIDVRVDVADASLELPEADAALIYRVTGECVRNVRKHARATQVEVTLDVTGPDRWTLGVADNGTGFDLPAVRLRPRPGHVGLSVMADLARRAGAELAISSSASSSGVGTRVRLSRSER